MGMIMYQRHHKRLPARYKSQRFNASINYYHLGSVIFGEIQNTKNKKSTLHYYVLCLSSYPLMLLFVIYMLVAKVQLFSGNI